MEDALNGAPAASAPQDILDTPRAGHVVIRGGATRLGGYLLGVLLSVGSASVLLRYLSVRDFGRYTIVTSIVMVVGGLVEAGLTNVGVREFAVTSGPDRDRMMSSLLGVRLAIGVVGLIAGCVFVLIAGYPDVILAGTAVAGAGLLVYTFQMTYGVPLQAGLRLGWVTSIELTRQAATVAIMVAVIVAGGGLVALLAVPIPVSALVVVMTVAVIRRAVPLRPTFDATAWRALLKIALPYAAATAVGVIYAYLTVIIMSLASTEQQTGYFSAAFRVFVVLAGIPGTVLPSVLPILSRAARDDRHRLTYGLQRSLEVSVAGGTLLTLATVFGAPAALEVLGGPGYEPAIGVLRIQGVALVATALIALGGMALLSLGAHRALLLANLGGLLTSLVLTLVLVPDHGAHGAAWANLGGEVVLAALYGIGIARAGVRLRFGFVLRVAAAVAPAIAAGALSGLPSVPAAILSCVVFCIGAIAFRAVPVEIYEALRRR